MPSPLPSIAIGTCLATAVGPAFAAGNNEPTTPPNIVLILSDDVGYSDIGCYGGEINTPNLDRLAKDGVRFTQFYNVARCCPSRASLLTGLYPHAAGVGHMVNDRGPAMPGYRGRINEQCRTIAEVLRPAGYRNYISGKWHVDDPKGPDSPIGNWPLQRGFDKFYGTLGGAGSYYDPTTLCRGNTWITPENDPEYKPKKFYYTDAITDNALTFLKQHEQESPNKPFFMYVAYTAAHWPLQAHEEDIAKYKGRYHEGYDAVRRERIAKMRQLGLLDKEWEPSPTAGDWENAAHRDWEERCMEVYAAQVDRMDQGIGRIVDALKRSGRLDNTIIIYLQDNGACAEPFGREVTPPPPNLHKMAPDELQQATWPPMQTRDGRAVRTGPGVMPGAEDTFVAYGLAWANVSNTPYREYKHWVHEGGIATPLIVHWPRGISRQQNGGLVSDPGHVIDIMATCADVAGAKYPTTDSRNSERITPAAGISLRPAFDGQALSRGKPIFWEHEGNRAVRIGHWKLVAKSAAGAWELYDMDKDRTEQHDLASQHPDIVATLASQWTAWAEENLVLPWPWKPAYDPAAATRLSQGKN